jgi:hypothetical protein
MDSMNIPNGSEWLGEELGVEVDETYEGSGKSRKGKGPKDAQSNRE